MATGRIVAAPNPCPLDLSRGLGMVALVWTTQDVALAEIGIEDILGGTERVSPTTTRGSVLVEDIEGPPHQYTFRLYARHDDSRVLLDSVVVAATAASTPVGTIRAAPNPCPIRRGQRGGVVALSWLARHVSAVMVTIEEGGAGERLYSSEPAGELTVDWIDGAPEQCTFRLYDTSNGSTALLDSVVVDWMVTD